MKAYVLWNQAKNMNKPKLKSKLLTVCLLLLLGLGLVGNFVPQAKSFPSVLSTDNTIFMQKFSNWYDTIHAYLNTTDFSLHHWYWTVGEEPHSKERNNLATHALYLTFAYELTGDLKYLHEAKYFVDNLINYVDATKKCLINEDYLGAYGWLGADTQLLWTETRLNQFYGQTYDVKTEIDYIISKASVNNATDLGWYYFWTDVSTAETLNSWQYFMTYLAYLTANNIYNYQTAVQKIYHYTEKQRKSDDLYPYNVGDATSNPDYSVGIIMFQIIASNYLSNIFNTTKIQASLTSLGRAMFVSYGSMDDMGGSGSLAEIARYKGYNIGQRLKTALKQTIDLYYFNKKNYDVGYPDGQRLLLLRTILLPFAISKSTTFEYSYGSYLKYGDWYQPDTIFSYNQTFLYDNYGFIEHIDGSDQLTCWYQLGWQFATFVYNSTGEYWQGFKDGSGSGFGTLTMRFYRNMGKVVVIRSQPNTNTIYRDYLCTANTNEGNVYLLFTNGTMYNVTSLSSTTNITITDSKYFGFIWRQYFRIIKTDTTNDLYTIIVSDSFRKIATTYSNAKNYEVANFLLPSTNSSALQTKRLSILTEYANGTDDREQTYPTPEGMMKWQLKHYSDVSIYTNKNMTSSSYGGNVITFVISAPSGNTSTTKVYVGDKGKPTSVSGATSWSYNEATKILTITVVHSSPATITVDWTSRIVSYFTEAATIILAFFTLEILFTVIYFVEFDKKLTNYQKFLRIIKITIATIIIATILIVFAQILLV